jgi:hypothetical protein
MSRDGRVRSGSVVGPLLLIAIGTLLLLWRWLPDFNPWPVLWKYWPLFLILVGAGMIVDRLNRQRHPEAPPMFPVGSAIGTVLFVLTLTFLLWHHHSYRARDWSSSFASSSARTHETKTIDKAGAKAVHLNLEMPAGELRLEGGVAGESLLNADFSHGGTWSTPEVEYEVKDGRGDLSITQEGGGRIIGNSDNVWNLKVTDSVPIELKIDVGAGKGDLRLAKVDLTRLEVNIGAGQAVVDLTGERAKDLQAQIHGGVGEAIVRLPKNIGVVAIVHGGLGAVDVHGLKSDEDGQYVNAAYGKAPNTIHLTVEGGIGHIKLEQE